MTLNYKNISRAITGDDKALNTIVKHYEDYIDALIYAYEYLFDEEPISNTEEIKKKINERLRIAILKFEERI